MSKNETRKWCDMGLICYCSGEASQWKESFQADWLCGNGTEVCFKDGRELGIYLQYI